MIALEVAIVGATGLVGQELLKILEEQKFPAASVRLFDTDKPQGGEYFVRKHTYSGFYSTRLDDLLRNLDVKNLICVGYMTGVCLLTTLVDALFRDYKVVLVRDATLGSETSLVDSEDPLFNNITARFVRYIECFVGVTVSAEEFAEACATASR